MLLAFASAWRTCSGKLVILGGVRHTNSTKILQEQLMAVAFILI